jgi:PilZ domain
MTIGKANLTDAGVLEQSCRMTKSANPTIQGSDWTRLLTDSDLVIHLPTLLKTYREVAPNEREAALLNVMRKIKAAALEANSSKENKASRTQPEKLYSPVPITQTPPFDADSFPLEMATDRRSSPRIRCYVAVEIEIEGVREPVWGNLANLSRGGCLVETATAVPSNKALKIGLWLASGKIWVKGVILTGMATRNTASYGVRVKFSPEELAEREHLREFLKFVENMTRKSHSGNAYVAKLKA